MLGGLRLASPHLGFPICVRWVGPAFGGPAWLVLEFTRLVNIWIPQEIGIGEAPEPGIRGCQNLWGLSLWLGAQGVISDLATCGPVQCRQHKAS